LELSTSGAGVYIRLSLFRLNEASSRLQSDPLTWADVISKCTEGAAFLAEVQMSKLEKIAAANCKTLAHDAKQAFTADIIGRLAKDMPPAEAAKYFGVSECAFVMCVCLIMLRLFSRTCSNRSQKREEGC